MDDWTQAIYDKTGIPLQEGDLTLAFEGGQWWLALHHHAFLPVGTAPDPHVAVTPTIRGALARAMKKRLSDSLPKVQRLVDALGATPDQAVTIAVVNTEEGAVPFLDDATSERGWPHFLLRLSAKGFDVEVDLDPYMPDAPFDPDEVQRQAEIIVQVARST
ncbi:MAG: hypothetical protein AAF211_33540 [Myxococcota bacterium]